MCKTLELESGKIYFHTFFERRESLEEEEDLRETERFREEVRALPDSPSSCAIMIFNTIVRKIMVIVVDA